MNFMRKGLVIALTICVMSVIAASDSEGQSSKPGSSKPGSSSQSKSDSSKPKYTAPPPKADPPKTEPPKSDGSKPKYTAPPPSQKEDKDKDKPKYTAPPKDTSKDQPKGPPTSAPKDGPRPDSSKPKTDQNVGGKAQAAKEARSERKFEESQKAVAPPKPKYTAPNGSEVLIKPDSRQVAAVRNQPSEILRPEVRQQNTVTHIHTYHYHHDYNWYRTQPVVYVGGGYSSSFWYMMAEWNAERRALWLYNNRDNIERDAYQRGLRDAEVARIVARMEAQRINRDPDYIDPEFNRAPHLMYDEDFVEAAYNPTVVPVRHNTTPTDPGAALNVFLILGCIVLGGLILWGAYYLVFRAKIGD